jgi:hypothetical protein
VQDEQTLLYAKSFADQTRQGRLDRLEVLRRLLRQLREQTELDSLKKIAKAIGKSHGILSNATLDDSSRWPSVDTTEELIGLLEKALASRKLTPAKNEPDEKPAPVGPPAPPSTPPPASPATPTDDEVIAAWRQARRANAEAYPVHGIVKQLGFTKRSVYRLAENGRKPSDPAKLAAAILNQFPELGQSDPITPETQPATTEPQTETQATQRVQTLPPPARVPTPQIGNAMGGILSVLNGGVHAFGYLMANGGSVNYNQQLALARLAVDLLKYANVDAESLDQAFSLNPIDRNDPMMKELLGVLASNSSKK